MKPATKNTLKYIGARRSVQARIRSAAGTVPAAMNPKNCRPMNRAAAPYTRHVRAPLLSFASFRQNCRKHGGNSAMPAASSSMSPQSSASRRPEGEIAYTTKKSAQSAEKWRRNGSPGRLMATRVPRPRQKKPIRAR